MLQVRTMSQSCCFPALLQQISPCVFSWCCAGFTDDFRPEELAPADELFEEGVWVHGMLQVCGGRGTHYSMRLAVHAR
jgi:hypothetical protein